MTELTGFLISVCAQLNIAICASDMYTLQYISKVWTHGHYWHPNINLWGLIWSILYYLFYWFTWTFNSNPSFFYSSLISAFSMLMLSLGLFSFRYLCCENEDELIEWTATFYSIQVSSPSHNSLTRKLTIIYILIFYFFFLFIV